ncbi:hypothetical protein N7478_011980 [Penicillium angulare]|uniref:uncharacterized protein n=1 Tax=Penicillium angulare TaxID=116970 RepID=UPI002540D737|nr:uncharacterized protein N7478_011980 [Penicillium angulare]KAJ5261385.1 hypothetical protein N7478_011980 [Penicillium angulare]
MQIFHTIIIAALATFAAAGIACVQRLVNIRVGGTTCPDGYNCATGIVGGNGPVGPYCAPNPRLQAGAEIWRRGDS